MPNCWEEFKGWLRSFTRIESLLTILEAIFLFLLLAFMIFLILHFIACPEPKVPTTTTKTTRPTTNGEGKKQLTGMRKRPTCTYTADLNVVKDTEAIEEPNAQGNVSLDFDRNLLPGDMSDGELADDDEKQVVMALVRIRPSGLTFGCILTVVSGHWTVTAASCIDAIEEVDSLDNFVIIDNYDEINKGRSHPVSDVRVHPLYEGRNKSYDLALLKTDYKLRRRPVALPSLLDYFKMTIGEKGQILGFGHFRTIDHSSNGQRVHSAAVHLLPVKHCLSSEFEERHLIPAAPIAHGRCGLAPMCLGVLFSRGTPCNYCAGAPLLRGRVLLGVMADNEQCGAACEPALYANMAAAKDWIVQVLGT